MLGGAATMIIGYLMSQPDVTFLSLVGIGVVALGIAFIILARRR
jgi:multidrug transporter EmrE-like cation transporter